MPEKAHKPRAIPRGTAITLRQYLIFGSLERGYSPADAERFADDYKEKHPQAGMSDKASYDSWEARRKAGTLS